MPTLPTGTVTFLFADIEVSTRLLQQLGDHYADALATHRRLLRGAFQERGGQEVDVQGDACFVVFSRAQDAVAGALSAQRAIAAHHWPQDAALRVRIGLHTGEPQASATGYTGIDVHRAARICAAGHGGQILLSQTTRELVADDLPEGMSLRDLGEHRLKDLARPLHLFQVVARNLPIDFPPLKSLDALPNNLPLQLTGFIGREAVVADVKRLLSTTRLLTLTGIGGCGKTRLALHVAAEILEGYPHGVWLVELAALAEPTLVPQMVASTLSVREQPDRPVTDTLRDYLAPKRLLLVWDNCEHVLSACGHLANTLLRGCPNLMILTTSREGLGVAGETLYPVPSLSLPDPHRSSTVEELRACAAVQLFDERASAVLPSFRLTASNAQAVMRVCTRLDGIPLPIELAAARVKMFPPEEIARRLDDQFRLLTGGSRTALPRHQTLRAAMDWSYDLLPEKERALLRQLSVFAGGWTLEAAEVIGTGQEIATIEVLDLLTRLVDKSLVSVDEHEGKARYRFLETVRQYGQDRLVERGEADTVRERHRDFFLALAEQAVPHLRGPEQLAWLNRLEAEHDNLRAALEWSQGRGDAASGLRLAGAMWLFWRIRSHFREGRKWLEAALAPTGEMRTKTRAIALRAAGILAREQGDPVLARARFHESIAIFRELRDQQGVADSLMALWHVPTHEGDHAAAAALVEESLSISRAIGYDWGIAESLHLLGHGALNRGEYAHTQSLFEESVAKFRSTGNWWSLAHPLCDVGREARRRGDYATARSVFEESLAIFRELRSKAGIAMLLGDLGEVAAAEGNYADASSRFEESLILFRELGSKRDIAEVLNDRAEVAARQGHYPEARTLIDEAMGLSKELSDKWRTAMSLRTLGNIARRQHEPGGGATFFKESLSLFRELGNKIGIIACLEKLAGVEASQGQPRRAAKLLGTTEALRNTIGVPLTPADREEHDRTVSALRTDLGEDRFEAARTEGAAMTLEQAIGYALSDS